MPFQPNLMFLTMARAYLSGAPLYGWLLTLLINIRLGWRGLPGTNTLACLKNWWITTVKNIYRMGSWWKFWSLPSSSSSFSFSQGGIHKTSYDNLTITIVPGVPLLHITKIKSTDYFFDKAPLPKKWSHNVRKTFCEYQGWFLKQQMASLGKNNN
jgi:hypothetical protein